MVRLFVRKIKYALPLVLMTGASMTQAAALKSSCYVQNSSESLPIQGVDIDKKFEIASVSKVITSYWAIAKMGATGRFQTKINIKSAGTDLFDVHLSGSRDPFMGHQSLQLIAAELNRLGVYKIKKLSFDEDFKFMDEVQASHVAQGFYVNSDPSEKRVTTELKVALNSLSSRYQLTVQAAKNLSQLTLPQKIMLKVSEIEFKSKSQFEESRDSKTYQYFSAPVYRLLKEMNRNSNNHAANQIFESLGGSDKFSQFINVKLGFTEKQIKMYNGSGDRFMISDKEKVYNMATCTTLIRIVQGLKNTLANQGDFRLDDVMSVAGEDASTLKTYENDNTDSSLIAKTGTVNPSVTLAGTISTQDGEIYFGFIMGTDGSRADWTAGRNKISGEVTQLYKKFHGSKKIQYSSTDFLPFDAESVFTEYRNSANGLK